MLVANSFDLWRKDTFFSAAEEVQESADRMESAYRRWVRERREGVAPEYLNELSRELQTTLGTAKWQLEEFEKAVMLSYKNRADEITIARHRQFVVAMESQISSVEAALRESFKVEGQRPLRWVNLDEEECDDLALFLSGGPRTSLTIKDDCTKLGAPSKSSPQNQFAKIDLELKAKITSTKDISDQTKASKDVTRIMDSDYTAEQGNEENLGTRDRIHCQADRTIGMRGAWSLPNIDSLKIVIDEGDEEKKALIPAIEATPKEKGFKPLFWKQRCGDPWAKGGILSYTQLRGVKCINRLFGPVGGSQRQLQTPACSWFSCSIQLKLACVLTIFLIVPFVLFST